LPNSEQVDNTLSPLGQGNIDPVKVLPGVQPKAVTIAVPRLTDSEMGVDAIAPNDEPVNPQFVPGNTRRNPSSIKLNVPSESNPINVDRRYAKLETLLKAQDFRAADEETSKVMLAVANRESEGWLREEDAEKFPCKELRSIDQLWLKYSRGKFGISVQQQIYQSLGGGTNWDTLWSFSDRVGWMQCQGGYCEIVEDSNLNFSQTAPSGHLPTLRIGVRKLPRSEEKVTKKPPHNSYKKSNINKKPPRRDWEIFCTLPSCPDMQSVTHKNFQRS
jgi:hypothetical protein